MTNGSKIHNLANHKHSNINPNSQCMFYEQQGSISDMVIEMETSKVLHP